MNNRLKELRDSKGLSQEEFGSKIGIKSRAHISALESGSRNITDRIISDICREYGVREEWLRYGKLPMKAEALTFSLDEFAKQHDATELELNILKAYFELDPDLRGKLVKHFKERITAAHTSVSVEDAEELYKKSRSNSAQSMGSSASNTTGGTGQEAKEA